MGTSEPRRRVSDRPSTTPSHTDYSDPKAPPIERRRRRAGSAASLRPKHWQTESGPLDFDTESARIVDGGGVVVIIPTTVKLVARFDVPGLDRVELSCSLDADGVYAIHDMRLVAAAPDVPIDFDAFRQVDTAAMLFDAIKPQVTVLDAPQVADDQAPVLDVLREYQPPADSNVRTAVVYMLARAVGGKPTTAVARDAGVSQAAAAQRVRRAREAGLIPPSTPGKVS